MSLLITKRAANIFSLQLNNEMPIISEQNRLTTVGDFCHFKTVSGANIIKEQNVLYSDITLVASGSFSFASINALWLKLIEVGFFDGLNGTGGGGIGTGIEEFTQLLDTFNSYIGRDGQALVVNESQQKIETVPFSNVSKFTDLSDTPNPLQPNKMIVTNASGTALIMADLPSITPPLLNAYGFIDYENTGTNQNAVAGVELKLTNNKSGLNTNTNNAPFGVSDLFNSVTNQFDFSQLNVGDWVDFRPDLNIDLAGTNTSFKLYMKMAIGSGAEWQLNIHNGERKSTDEFREMPYFGFYIGSENERDFPADLYILTDANGIVKVNGFLFKVLRKGINIVDIDAVTLTTNQSIEGVKTFVASPIVPTATLPNQAVNLSQLQAFGSSVDTKITTTSTITENTTSKTINVGWEWEILGVAYTNTTNINIPITLAAAGKSRIDFIVPNNTNGFDLIQGAEVTNSPSAPILPYPNFYVTFFTVTDSLIGNTAPPGVINPISGVVTTNRIAKGVENGMIGDSVITEKNGKIGIGTSNPLAQLHIVSDINAGGWILLDSRGGNPTIESLFGLNFKASGLNSMFFSNGGVVIGSGYANAFECPFNGALIQGNTLIGKTTDNGVDKLQVNGSISATEGTATDNVVINSQLSDVIIITTSQVAQESWINKQIYIKANVTLTIPNSLSENWNVNYRVFPNVSMNLATSGGATWEADTDLTPIEPRSFGSIFKHDGVFILIR